MPISYPDAAFIGTLLSQLLLGAYIVVFGIFVKIVRVRKSALGAVDYGLFALFVICVATIVLDSVQQFHTLLRGGAPWIAKANSAASTLSLTLDFIAQVILIYRCWIVWGQQILVVALPAFLALTSYVAGLCVTIDLASEMNSFEFIAKDWWVPLGVSCFSLSLAVNVIVSGLMISRIMYVYRQSHGASPGSVARASLAVSVFLESAIALAIAQLVYLVLYRLEHPAFSLVAGPVTVIYALNATAIMVRVGMNHSYETAMAQGSTTAIHQGGASPNSKGPGSADDNDSREKFDSPV